MGLISSLSNAVTGLRTSQDSITILSRNIANSGTPGYHRQSLNIIDYSSINSTYARSAGVDRAFNLSLQGYYNRQVSDTSMSNVTGDYLSRLEGYLGKPGSAGSLDTMFGSFKNSLQALSTSPDDYPTRANVVAEAQAFAQRLNSLSGVIQQLRQEAETRIANDVSEANAMLISLNEVNNRMLDLGMTDTSRAQLLDQRDRLVAAVAEVIDVQAEYRPNGTVALMTRSGVGLLDNGFSTFKFTTAGALSPTAQASSDPEASKVGTLSLTTPSGLSIDLVQQGVLQGGELAGLVNLRDKILVEAQNQLDEIAAGVAAVFNTITTAGTAATGGGGAEGLSADISYLKPGNDVLLNYTQNGAQQRVRIINSTNGEDFIDASGQRVISVDLSDSTAAAATLQAKLPGLAITSPSAGVLQVLDDGTGGAMDVTGLTTRGSATGTQQGELAMALFVDQGNSAFTGNLDTNPPQIMGFAARISVNPAVISDNRLLVQFDIDGTLGDASRPQYILDQLSAMTFVSGTSPTANEGRHQLNGTIEQLIEQVLNYQGTSIGSAMSARDNRQLTLDTITTQMESEYGVNMDEEMARLTELQSAYAANARVVSVVKELLDTLFAST
ncbi:flagellar hook-associated protein FlgK [Devosia sp. XJ19-1]|uniref:Flagellar hook-associated protein 1 n=1 Tax=Devosia ureilytica TaxID=2952754 RepID=A0A9Q4FSF4_9HYPH|nr:flagellar hook-associated protein FlgK [Devosia ureilytica]MCP8883530.1 flagellar hook-associated protein FlgK [Devosia ureilytica]MCP8887138.1 flagellar hook-associated protein FlgK [Devosia ureilytica]